MRINFISQDKDDKQKNFWAVLKDKLNLNSSLVKMASTHGVENPREIVKEGLIISYKPSGEYTIKLGHKSDIVVTGVAKQEKELHQHVKRALSYLKSISPKVESELRTIEASRHDMVVYKDIDRCRDCVFYESDTSHETYRDKCKNCKHATLGGEIDNFFPRSQQMVMFVPQWEQVGDSKVAFQGTLSMLDAHRQGKTKERNTDSMADEVLDSVKEANALNLGTALFKYFEDNKLNFQKYARPVVEAIEKKSGIQVHTRDGENVIIAFDKDATKKPKAMPGALSKCDQEALDKYEEAKDNISKSKELMPKGSKLSKEDYAEMERERKAEKQYEEDAEKKFIEEDKKSSFSGTLCLAEVKE